MDGLKLSDNITRLRHERNITQEELADFIGVTKASVSKWENAQSIPDLMLLLQLAAFFGVTVDELIGYEAQLSNEQIRRCYAELAKGFANLPFEEALDKVRSMAHQYYSCYPFLMQLSVLYLNHYMLAETPEGQIQILEEAIAWCGHILKDCSDVDMCQDALVMKARLNLQLGRTSEVIRLLEPSSNPVRLAGQEGAMLVQAYQMAGENEKARSHIQLREYLDLLNLTSDALLSLPLYENDLERCEETIYRIRGVMEQYQMEQLHPNLAAQFHYQTAVTYAANKKAKEALDALCHFEMCVNSLLGAKETVLHGDKYFNLLDAWIEQLPLGNMAPRDKGFICQNVKESLSHPAFADLRENKDFQKMLQRFSSNRSDI